jgi:2-phosphosulfolactate phosphatase
MPTLDLFHLPQHVPSEALANATVIVVDLLRASTTICQALVAGAECVMPFAEIDRTLQLADKFGRNRVLLGGERGGRRIPGFNLGNSPAEYTPERVAGRRILFTTTNGARALDHVKDAQRVLVGAAVNRLAIAEAVANSKQVAIICAGTDGEIAREDILAGGAIVDAVFEQMNCWSLGPNALAARDAWRQVVSSAEQAKRGLAEQFALELRDTQGGRNLLEIGQAADLPLCARLDVLNVVPELRTAANELHAA